MNNEELEKEIEERVQKKATEVEKEKMEVSEKTNNNNLPTEKIEMPNFIPQIDTSKELEDQASDVVKLLGAQRASQKEDFMEEVSKKFQKGVLSEQEVRNMQKSRLLEQEYFLKWQDVLKFVFIKSPHGLLFMQIMTIVAMLIYVPTRIIGMVVKAIGMIGDFINEIFNSIFGGKGHYLKNANGDVVIDPITKRPYIEKQGYNLFAKVLFGIIIGGICLALIFIFIKLFTGFNVFEWFRSVI